jgi:hypothetical protein
MGRYSELQPRKTRSSKDRRSLPIFQGAPSEQSSLTKRACSSSVTLDAHARDRRTPHVTKERGKDVKFPRTLLISTHDVGFWESGQRTPPSSPPRESIRMERPFNFTARLPPPAKYPTGRHYRHSSDFYVKYSTTRAVSENRKPTCLLSVALPDNKTNQIDGSSDEQTSCRLKAPALARSRLSHVRNTTEESNESQSLPSPPPSPIPETSHQTQRLERESTDLPSPTPSVFPQPSDLSIETPTPLTKASPAQGGFPFPRVARDGSPLTPLKLRARGLSLLQSRASVPTSRSGSRTPSSQTPDRFIYPRNSGSIRDAFETRQSPTTLPFHERIARSHHAAPNPFGRRVRSISHGQIEEELRRSRIHLDSHRPNNLRSGNSTLGLRRGSITDGTRQISTGAVWNVGGSYAAIGDSVAGTTDGRRGLLSTGTSAPLYSANFLDRLDPREEVEAHSRRVALALDVDISARILNSPISPSESTNVVSPPSSSSSTPHVHRQFGSPVWKDSAWVKEGDTSSLL